MALTELISRKDARKRGLTRYLTGVACPKGHIAERTVSNKACVECSRHARSVSHDRNFEKEREYRLARYRENPERFKAETRAWRKANPGRVNEYTASYRVKNPEWAKAQSLKYAEKKRVEIQSRSKAWRSKNKDRQNYHSTKKKAIKIAAVPVISDEMLPFFNAELMAIYAECRSVVELTGIVHHVDHIYPLSKGGVHAPWNLRIMTGVENQKKKDKWPKNEAVSVIWHGEIVSRIKENF